LSIRNSSNISHGKLGGKERGLGKPPMLKKESREGRLLTRETNPTKIKGGMGKKG